MVLTPEQREMIQKLRSMDAAAKAPPWHYGGAPGRDGKTIYKMAPAEENLVILMRNSIGELLDIIDTLEKEKTNG